MTTDYKIGLTVGGLSTLSTLGVTDPDPLPSHYAESVTLGDGTQRGAGWLQAEWRWSRLYLDELRALQVYCPGSSASVVVKTLNRGGGFQVYNATMVWPQWEPAYQSDCYDDFVIQFRELVAVGT